MRKPIKKNRKTAEHRRQTKALEMYGSNALKVIQITEPAWRHYNKSLMLAVLQGIARGMPVSEEAWDGELARRAAREALTLIGEVW